MALKNYYTKEEHEMQELVQKQIDLAGFGGVNCPLCQGHFELV